MKFLLIIFTAHLIAFNQPAKTEYLFTEAKYTTLSPQTKDYVPKADMKNLKIHFVITEKTVTIRLFSPTTFNIIDQSQSRISNGTKTAYTLKDKQDKKCYLSVTEMVANGRKKLDAVLMSDRSDEGYYHQCVEYIGVQ